MTHEEIMTLPKEDSQFKSDWLDGYEQGRANAIDELKDKKDEIIRWLIKRDKEWYGTTNGELLDHILDIAEQLKDVVRNDN